MTFYGVLAPVLCPILLENDVILHLLSASYTPSYTLSYTRNPQQTQGIFAPWCRNVGYFQKTFLGERHLKRFSSAGREIKNIGLLCHKLPYFHAKTSELSLKEVRCFPQKKTINHKTYRRKRSIVSVPIWYTEDMCV